MYAQREKNQETPLRDDRTADTDAKSAEAIPATDKKLGHGSASEAATTTKLPPLQKSSPPETQTGRNNVSVNKAASITRDVETVQRAESKKNIQTQISVEKRRISRSKSVVNVLKIHSPDSPVGAAVDDGVENKPGKDGLERHGSEMSLVGDNKALINEVSNYANDGISTPRKLTKDFASDSFIFQEANEREDDGGMEDANFLPPNHPLMQRYQLAIKEQLIQQKEQLQLSLKQSDKLLKKARSDYEKLGVEVYAMKEELATLTKAITQKGDQLSGITQERSSIDDYLGPMRGQIKNARLRIDELVKDEKAFHDELRRLNIQINELASDKEITNHVLIAKNAVKKAQQDLTTAEKEKIRQDNLTSRLANTVAGKEAELRTVEGELQSATAEIAEKRQRLLVLNAEAQSISIEKRNLFQRWDATLKGMRRRDEEFAEVHTALRNHQQNATRFESELSGLAKVYSNARELNDRLIGTVVRLQDDVEHCSKLIKDLHAKNANVEAEIAVCQQEVEDIVSQKNSIRQERSSLSGTLSNVLSRLRIERNEMVKLDELAWGDGFNNQGNDKALVEAVKELEKLKRAARDMELTCNGLQRELEKEIVLCSEVESTTQSAKKVYEDHKDMTERTRLNVERLQQDLERQAGVYEKKLAQLCLLQQRSNLDNKTSEGSPNVNLNSMRFELETLQKNINSCDDRVSVLQKEWTKMQDQLIKVSELIDKENSTINDLMNSQLELEQHNIRLNGEIRISEEEELQIGKGVDKMHLQISKQNEAITKRLGDKATIEDNNFAAFAHIGNKIRDAEVDCVQMEEKLERKLKEKRELEKTLEEAEGQWRIWEEKTTNARAIRESINQAQGDEGVSRMVADMHRMQTRIGQLTKVQESTARDMEKAVSKRHVLLQKGEAVSTAKTVQLTQAQLNRAVVDLRRKMKQFQKDLEAAEREEEGCRVELERMASNNEAANTVEMVAMRTRAQLIEELGELESIHFKNSHILAAQQMRHKRLEDAREGKYEPLCRDHSAVEIRRHDEEKKRALMRQLVNAIKDKYPDCGGSLKKVEVLLSI